MAQDSTAPSVIPKETLAQMDEALGLSNTTSTVRPAGVFTRGEYERSVGISPTTAKKRLTRLVAAGILEVFEIKIPRTGGGANRVPGYRMKPKPPATEADGANASGLGTA